MPCCSLAVLLGGGGEGLKELLEVPMPRLGCSPLAVTESQGGSMPSKALPLQASPSHVPMMRQGQGAATQCWA
ncbi:hypothetical protein HaLaN_00828 [Haematococcus lacustris]|uniref:Uncharacterized protein n=1 Tax=Haematococcus lacustris TaxID=44745 RepID=A0A699YT04_HAELA|nr:hypothetical protein HaLaN_00828 [Haematococcus lacustris]